MIEDLQVKVVPYTKTEDNKILEKSGYSEVFDDNNQIDGSSYSDYNSIKDAVHSKLRN